MHSRSNLSLLTLINAGPPHKWAGISIWELGVAISHLVAETTLLNRPTSPSLFLIPLFCQPSVGQSQARETLASDGRMEIVLAHRDPEVWGALVMMIRAGFIVPPYMVRRITSWLFAGIVDKDVTAK